MQRVFLASFIAGLALATGANACPTYSLTGTTYSLTGDQLYSPDSFNVVAGGQDDLRTCPQPGVGYVTTAPDFTFYLSGMDRYDLLLDVVSACDATLLVNTADAQWHFDDDSNGNLDPRLDLRGASALNGRVDVWVGSYNGQYCDATLTLETFLSSGGGGGGSTGVGCPDPSRPGPSYAMTGQQLSTRHSLPVTATGGTALSSCGIPGTGYAAAIPTASLMLSGMVGYDLVLDVESTCDSTLLINSASGMWFFDDDSNGNLDPRVTISSGLEGRVDIWVGSYSGSDCQGTLYMETFAAGSSGGTGTGGFTQGASLAGQWYWEAISRPITINANGTGHDGVNTITWTGPDANGTYTLTWSHGYTDYATLTGNRLEIVNNEGFRFGATRLGGDLENPPGSGASQGQPGNSATVLEGAWTIDSFGYGGTLTFDRHANGWSATVRFNVNDFEEILQNVQFDPVTGEVQFYRERGTQHYVGTLSGGEITGMFNRGPGTPYDSGWSATR
jgi:hypothetical protein